MFRKTKDSEILGGMTAAALFVLGVLVGVITTPFMYGFQSEPEIVRVQVCDDPAPDYSHGVNVPIPEACSL